MIDQQEQTMNRFYLEIFDLYTACLFRAHPRLLARSEGDVKLAYHPGGAIRIYDWHRTPRPC